MENRWYAFYKTRKNLEAYLKPRQAVSDRKVYAVYLDNIEALKLLLTEDEPVEKLIDIDKNTVLHVAVMLESKKVFDYLLTFDGLPLDALNREKQSPLLLSLQSSDEYFALRLIEAGADPNLCDHKGKSPLHFTILENMTKTSQQLIQQGADINKQNRIGATPLHIACKIDSAEGVCMLLYYGADVWIRNNSNCTPFDQAIISSNFTIQEILFDYMFDAHTQYTLRLDRLILLVESNSPITSNLLGKIADVNLITDNIADLFFLEPQHFGLVLEHLSWLLERVLTCYIFHEIKSDFVNKINLVEGRFYYCLNSLLESHLGADTITFFHAAHSIVKSLGDLVPSKFINGLVHCLLTYGMEVYEIDLHYVYMVYGYCDLFELLLYLNVRIDLHGLLYKVHPMVLLMYDVTMDIDAIAENFNAFPLCTLHELLCISADPELKNYCLRSDIPMLVEKAKTLPSIPSLLELSRNVAREFIISNYEIRSSGQFYTIIKRLNIGEVYEKILTYQSKVY